MTLVHPCGDVHDISVICVTSLHKSVHGHLSRRGKCCVEIGYISVAMIGY